MTAATALATGTREHGAGPMPKVADYQAAYSLLSDADVAVEDICMRIKRHLDKHDSTLADVGALWSYIESTEVNVDQLERRVLDLRTLLRTLDDRRLDLASLKETELQ